MSVDPTLNMVKNSVANNKIGFISIFLLGINGIIGSGIFLLPNQVYAKIGAASIAIVLIASLLVLVIALCYAELASKFSENGAAWIYSYRAFGRFIGFEVGFYAWILGIIILSSEIAGFLTALAGFFPSLKNNYLYNLSALLICIFLVVVNYFGVSLAKFLNNLSSVSKLMVIFLFVVVGIFYFDFSNFQPFILPEVVSNDSFYSSVGAALGVIFYAFTGFSFLPIAAARMENPQKNIPLALISVIMTCSVIYFLLVVVSISVLGTDLSVSSLPVADAFSKMVGDWGYNLIVIGMLISIGGVILAFSFSVPLIASSLALQHQLLPEFIGRKNKYNRPVNALIITFVLCSVLLLSGDYLFLISLAVFASFVQYVPTALAVIKLRSDKSLPVGFVIPGGPGVPILAILASLYLLSNFNLKIFIFGCAGLVVGAVVYFFQKKRGVD
ncbi:APC family permease [Deefgea piscis]|uniref:APC family permease n=1 Tax=Deefgea piscis TaxID=2739061 RepID=UPI001C8174B6|nr:APC family permease [Deefgea piscis]QZA80655.1 APC family permease [Deefgea piscis]